MLWQAILTSLLHRHHAWKRGLATPDFILRMMNILSAVLEQRPNSFSKGVCVKIVCVLVSIDSWVTRIMSEMTYEHIAPTVYLEAWCMCTSRNIKHVMKSFIVWLSSLLIIVLILLDAQRLLFVCNLILLYANVILSPIKKLLYSWDKVPKVQHRRLKRMRVLCYLCYVILYAHATSLYFWGQ